ncbi:hypothetical protein C8J57DRAFT_1237196 [Mycena rebaudengoi]|nr:hypothetical protein C8J57DRAFT_1237196 [Mycena rebaudengoi]
MSRVGDTMHPNCAGLHDCAGSCGKGAGGGACKRGRAHDKRRGIGNDGKPTYHAVSPEQYARPSGVVLGSRWLESWIYNAIHMATSVCQQSNFYGYGSINFSISFRLCNSVSISNLNGIKLTRGIRPSPRDTQKSSQSLRRCAKEVCGTPKMRLEHRAPVLEGIEGAGERGEALQNLKSFVRAAQRRAANTSEICIERREVAGVLLVEGAGNPHRGRCGVRGVHYGRWARMNADDALRGNHSSHFEKHRAAFDEGGGLEDGCIDNEGMHHAAGRTERDAEKASEECLSTEKPARISIIHIHIHLSFHLYFSNCNIT